MDIFTPGSTGFKRLGTDPAQMAVSTGPIVEHFDVLVDVGIGQILCDLYGVSLLPVRGLF